MVHLWERRLCLPYKGQWQRSLASLAAFLSCAAWNLPGSGTVQGPVSDPGSIDTHNSGHLPCSSTLLRCLPLCSSFCGCPKVSPLLFQPEICRFCSSRHRVEHKLRLVLGQKAAKAGDSPALNFSSRCHPFLPTFSSAVPSAVVFVNFVCMSYSAFTRTELKTNQLYFFEEKNDLLCLMSRYPGSHSKLLRK